MEVDKWNLVGGERQQTTFFLGSEEYVLQHDVLLHLTIHEASLLRESVGHLQKDSYMHDLLSSERVEHDVLFGRAAKLHVYWIMRRYANRLGGPVCGWALVSKDNKPELLGLLPGDSEYKHCWRLDVFVHKGMLRRGLATRMVGQVRSDYADDALRLFMYPTGETEACVALAGKHHNLVCVVPKS